MLKLLCIELGTEQLFGYVDTRYSPGKFWFYFIDSEIWNAGGFKDLMNEFKEIAADQGLQLNYGLCHPDEIKRLRKFKDYILFIPRL